MWPTRHCYCQAHNVDTLHRLLPIQEHKQCNLYCMTAQSPSHTRVSQCNLHCITAQPPSHTRVSQCNLYCITFSSDPRSTCFNKRTIATIVRNQNTCSLIQPCEETSRLHQWSHWFHLKLVLWGHHAGTLSQGQPD